VKKFFIVLSILFFLIGCSPTETQVLEEVGKTDTVKPTITSTPEPTQTKTSAPTEQESEGVQVDEGLLNVTVTFPASFFEELTDFDPDTYTEEQGFKETVVNEDGSITVTMSKRRHNELVDEMETAINETFEEIINSDDAPYVQEITASKDYRTVTVVVEKEAYESAWDFTPLSIWFSVYFYQMIKGEDYHCEVIIEDIETGETLKTVIYPDALE